MLLKKNKGRVGEAAPINEIKINLNPDSRSPNSCMLWQKQLPTFTNGCHHGHQRCIALAPHSGGWPGGGGSLFNTWIACKRCSRISKADGDLLRKEWEKESTSYC